MDTGERFREYEPGDILPVAGDDDRWYVLGQSLTWYEVKRGNESRPWDCECPHRQFRGALCHHITAVQRHLSGGWPTPADEAMTAWKALSEDAKKEIFR